MTSTSDKAGDASRNDDTAVLAAATQQQQQEEAGDGERAASATDVSNSNSSSMHSSDDVVDDDDDDEDAPVYFVGAVATVAEAVALVRTSPLSAHERACELAARTRDYPYEHYAHYTAAAARPRDLPATLQAFRACADYTAMLTVARRAVIDDALRGFAGEVARDSARLQRLREAAGDEQQQQEEQEHKDDDNDDVDDTRAVAAAALRASDAAERRLPHFIRYTHSSPHHHHNDTDNNNNDNDDKRDDAVSCAPPSRVRREWAFAWRQMTRDLHREVLLVDTIAYTEPTRAGAAIVSFLDSCYTRGQCAAAARLAALVHTLDTATAKAAAGTRRTNDNNNNNSNDTASATASQPPAVSHNPLSRVLHTVRRARVVRAAVSRARTAVSAVVERHASLVAASQRARAVRRVRALYPSDACARDAKVCAAAREIVLAAQQSFLAFPYQLLYEQVGMHRLASDDDGGAHDDDDDDAHNDDRGQPPPSSSSSSQPPLVIGEPSLDELSRFLAVVRARVRAYDERHATTTEAATTTTSTDNNIDTDSADASLLFRESVDGSVFLLPLPTTNSDDGRDGGDADDVNAATTTLASPPPPPQRGTRIHLYYSEARGVPVVCVSKLFRLSTPLTHRARTAWPQRAGDDDKNSGESGAEDTNVDDGRDKNTRSSSSDDGSSSRSRHSTDRAQQQPQPQVVLLLMQIQFSLFTDDEVEVRWRWHVL